MKFTVSFEFIYRYWNQVHTKHEKLFSISLESKEKQGRRQIQFIVFICLFIFDYKSLFACVKNKTYLRIAVPASSSNIFGSIFGVLLCLHIKKLILGSKTI